MKHFHYSFFLFSILFIWSCGSSKEDPKPDFQPEKLVNVTQVGKMSRSEIVEMGQQAFGSAASALALLLQYDVTYYKVTYKTQTPEGKEVLASGALILPDNGGSFPLVGYQHGTLFNESEAPSYFKAGGEGLIGMVLASAGFLTALPDYIGYGESKAEPHPYEHALGLAIPNTDMLLAVKEYFKEKETNWNRTLLLCGYSEGGYATMATQKYIEEKHKTDFNLKASSCGAGAYNKSLLLDELLNKPSTGDISHNRSYIWVLETYNRIYNLNKPTNYFFKEPYASQIDNQGLAIELSGSIHTFLNPDFVASYNSGNETELVNAFKENDLINWRTDVITRLTHGNADTYVPYINSTTALEGMKKAGSPQVSLKTVEGGNHTSSVQDFILETYTLFAANRI